MAHATVPNNVIPINAATNQILQHAQATALLSSYPCCFLKPRLKAPQGDGWQNKPRTISEWKPTTGIGIICGKIPNSDYSIHALDFDTYTPAMAEAMREKILARLCVIPGETLLRVGLPPKFLIPFKIKTELRKQTTKIFWTDPTDDESEKNQLEILGKNNQFVAYQIHPDTNRPYEWTNETTSTANLFDVCLEDLIELTQEDLDEIKKEFEATAAKLKLEQSEKDKAAAAAPVKSYNHRAINPGLGGVRDKIVSHYSIHEVLTKYGYKQYGRNSYLSPSSTTGSPGVRLLPNSGSEIERIYSHHSGNPLADGYSHDVASVLCILEYHGDFSAMIKSEAPIVDPEGQQQRQIEYVKKEKEPSQAKNIDLDLIESESEKKAQKILPDFPSDLLNLPYALGELQRYIYGRMSYPSMPTAGITAISALTAFVQTNMSIDSRDGLGFNEYYMILAPTGFGKEDLRKPVIQLEKLARDQINKNLSGSSLPPDAVSFQMAAPASAQGLHRLLEKNKSTFFMSDEFGEWLSQTKNQGHKQEALGYIMQLYSKAFGEISPGQVASKDQEYSPVKDPRVSIFATSTPDRLFSTMTEDQAYSGTYNRWLIFPGEEELPQKVYEGLIFEPEQSLVDFVKHVMLIHEKNGKISFSKEGFKAYIHFDKLLAEPIKRKDANLGGRLAEQAIKLAGLIAISDRRFEISPQDIETAFKIRVGLYNRTSVMVKTEGHMNGLHATGQALQQLIEALKRTEYIYISQLKNYSRKYKGLSILEQRLVVETLITDGCATKNGLKLLSNIHNKD